MSGASHPASAAEVSRGTVQSAGPGALLASALIHGVLIAAVCFALYPILWVIDLALSPEGSVGGRVLPIPEAPTLDHFVRVLTMTNDEGTWLFLRQLANSVLVSGSTALLAVAIATPAAYGFSRFNFLGSKLATETLLATQMFPGVASAIPVYLLMSSLGLLDTRTGLVLLYAASAVPFAIFQLRGAFDAIPKDLEEAAMVDGATQFGAALRVALPAARPAIAVTALFAFMQAWNEFILAATFLSREERFTLPVVLQRYVGEHHAEWGSFAAGAILVSVPVMLLFYALQKQFISGLTSGGVKG
jgi:arabinogalactan oligomer/maltooligosaccharide transport system permease protein